MGLPQATRGHPWKLIQNLWNTFPDRILLPFLGSVNHSALSFIVDRYLIWLSAFWLLLWWFESIRIDYEEPELIFTVLGNSDGMFTGKSITLSVITNWLQWFSRYCQLSVSGDLFRRISKNYRKSAAASTHRVPCLGPVLVSKKSGKVLNLSIGNHLE